MITKIFTSEAKALDNTQGLVEAFTNTMGVIDSDGDVIDPIAFNGSIAKNLPLPVLSGHDQHTVVGKVISARPVHIENDEYRLYTLMKMNMDTQAGRETFSNVSGQFTREWSVGFNVPDDGWAHEGEGKSQVRRIKELDWVEVSAVIRGASPSTQTISAKSQTEEKIEPDALDATPDEVAPDTSDLLRTKIEIEKLTLEAKMPKRKKPKRKY